MLLPKGADPHARPLLIARALRGFSDGYMAVLLPVYLLSLGLGTLDVGIISTGTMLGSALATLAVGAWSHRFASRALLRGAALLMMGTGLGFAGLHQFWPLLVVAFVGTLNPSSGDVSVFLPLEHANLAGMAKGGARTALFARYNLLGIFSAALGALAAGLPDGLARHGWLTREAALRGMFILYAGVGLVVWLLYRRLPVPKVDPSAAPASALGPSRAIVVRLAALFSLDSFAGGLVVNALLSLWLLQRFGLTAAQSGQVFFITGLLGAASQQAAPWVAGRIGLVNTMVFTHIPASFCLIGAALAPSWSFALPLLMMRSALASMDVPARTAFVMGVVTPAERAAAASFTAVPRSLAAAISPSLSGAMFAAGFLAAPLIACGTLKIVYDLALWRAFRLHPPQDD